MSMFFCYFSLGNQLATRKNITVDYTADRFIDAVDRRFSNIPPRLIITTRVFSKFGALGERFYKETI
jgi:hypothetical protein